ncbi:MAG: hypothetical protein Q9217_003485 [Psora testacea]
MADYATNEYLSSTRAQKDENDLFSAIGKQVLGLSLGDNDEPPEDERVKIVDEIQSLCMNCEENGTTRLLLTKIPFFREIIIMSFFCDHCNFRNNEIQPAGQIQEQGSKTTFKLTQMEDMQRQIVKSDSATMCIRELELEIPAGRGRLTDIEGIISEVLTGLESGQKERKVKDPETFEKIDVVVQSLIKKSMGVKFPFTIELDDPAGNSSIEPSPSDAAIKGKYTHIQYQRTPEQNFALGLGGAHEHTNGAAEIVPQVQQDDGNEMEDVDILEGQTYDLPIGCPGCTKPAHMLIQMVNIPHFKQVVLSTTQCDSCNLHVSEVKTGGEIPEKGKRIYLEVKGPEDLRRDILKGEHCLLRIPECEVEVQPGSMGGRFTTVEGLLTQVRDDLKGSIFDTGNEDGELDSMPLEKKKAWDEFFAQLDKAISGEMNYTVIMEDPVDGSYCQTLGEPGVDANVRNEDYERTDEENEHLGLSDMRTHLGDNGEYIKEPMANNSGGDCG